MISAKDIKQWGLGIVGALVTSLLIFSSSTLYNVDQSVAVMKTNLEFIVKQLSDHQDTLRDHEQRIRQLESDQRRESQR